MPHQARRYARTGFRHALKVIYVMLCVVTMTSCEARPHWGDDHNHNHSHVDPFQIDALLLPHLLGTGVFPCAREARARPPGDTVGNDDASMRKEIEANGGGDCADCVDAWWSTGSEPRNDNPWWTILFCTTKLYAIYWCTGMLLFSIGWAILCCLSAAATMAKQLLMSWSRLTGKQRCLLVCTFLLLCMAGHCSAGSQARFSTSIGYFKRRKRIRAKRRRNSVRTFPRLKHGAHSNKRGCNHFDTAGGVSWSFLRQPDTPPPYMTKEEMEKAMASAYHLPASTNAQWDPHVGQRIGDASNPGSEGPAFHDEPPDDFVDASEDELYPDLVDSDSDCDLAAEEAADRDAAVGENLTTGLWSDTDSESDRHSTSSLHTANHSKVAVDDGNVIPPWDAKLTLEQVQSWEAAEAKTGLKRSVTSWLAAKRKQAATQTGSCKLMFPAGTKFVESPTFVGSHSGYLYGTGDNGLGYYEDGGRH